LAFLLFLFSLPANLLAAVFINEIMYDLPGSDRGREWIEIHNSGPESVDLSGWNIETTANHRTFVLISGSLFLPPSGFAVIIENYESFKNDYPYFSGAILKSTFSLSNTFGKVILKNKDETIDVVNYTNVLGAKGDGNSIQRFADNWASYLPTPGGANRVSLSEKKKEIPLVLSGDKEKQVETTKTKEISTLPSERAEEEILKEEKVLSASINQSFDDSGSESNSVFKWLLILFGLFVVASFPIIFSSRSARTPEDINIEDIKIIEE